MQAHLIAGEALIATGRWNEAADRVARTTPMVDAALMPGAWGEFLRLRGAVAERASRINEAYHDFAQSVSVFELLNERYQAGLSHLALARLVSGTGARSLAARPRRRRCQAPG
jgi:hypothetical protein